MYSPNKKNSYTLHLQVICKSTGCFPFTSFHLGDSLTFITSILRSVSVNEALSHVCVKQAK